MRITLEMYKEKYTAESDSTDYTADELIEIFSRLLVQIGYPPDVIRFEDGGRYKCEYLMERD